MTEDTKEIEEQFKIHLLEKIEYLKRTKEDKCFDLFDINLAMKGSYYQGRIDVLKIVDIEFDKLNMDSLRDNMLDTILELKQSIHKKIEGESK